MIYMEKYRILKNNKLGEINEAEKKGINAWHISSFLDWDYN